MDSTLISTRPDERTVSLSRAGLKFFPGGNFIFWDPVLIYCEGVIADAPWGTTNATINYNYTE